MEALDIHANLKILIDLGGAWYGAKIIVYIIISFYKMVLEDKENAI